MNYVGIALAILAGIVIGATAPRNTKEAKKKVKNAKNVIEKIQEELPKKIRGDNCEKDDTSAMSEAYECTIEMFESDNKTSFKKPLESQLTPLQKQSLASYSENELADLVYKAVTSEQDFRKYDSVVRNHARHIAKAVKS